MTVLLDTHAFVWAIRAPKMLGLLAYQILESNETAVVVSAASIYEASAKVRLGKWPEAGLILDELEAVIAETGFRLLNITPSQALRAGRMPGAHRDPFDRIIAASALELDIPLLSLDAAMDSFGVRRIW